MKKTDIKELFRKTDVYKGSEILVEGWIRTLRDQKSFGFIELNDGTFFKNLQVVFEDGVVENFKEIAKLPIATAVRVKGELVETPGAKQPFELKAKEITVEATSDASFPLQKKRHTFEYLRTIAHLRPRANAFNAVFRVRSLAAYAIHKFFQENGFVYVNTPIITGSDAEGAGEMFKVTTLDLLNPPKENDEIDYTQDFFKRSTNLTVSGQLNGEAFALAYKNIYTFGPTFRSENSNTARHAAEFWMMEPEMAFADLTDYLDNAEAMLKFVINYVRENAPEEMEFFNSIIDKELFSRLDNVVNSDFGRITYTEAVKLLQESGQKFEYKVEWGADLQTEHERYLAETVFKKPVFVTDYPKAIKSFYMKQNPDGKTVAAADLLVPGVGELIGGSQREENYDKLVARMKELDMNIDDYWWYLELRKYGGVNHAGYGLGFERLLMYMTGINNIRDVIPFPRTVGTAEF
ncbi:MAG: asparagine--tRNA ligase [Peptostreptococcaceae bacterium]|nr:asparagine--tRNA ligase [Peptostreptococcaceae bacterium]